MTQARTLVLGGPGAGKTTRLLRVMEEALARGVPPDRIAFVAFTRAAAGEARDRAQERFGLSERELPYFRTLHSLAFREMGLRRGDVLDERGLAEVAETTGELDLTGPASGEDGPTSRRQADALMTIDHYARTTGAGLEGAWREHGGDVDWHRLKRFSEAYRLYKLDRGLLDFTDMLTAYARSGAPAPVDVAIVDEAQDLTMAQWAVAGRAFPDAAELWLAGDDDQLIHRWAGAAGDHFQALEHPREVLPVSHRLPAEIFDFAGSIIGQVARRFPKDHTHSGRAGSVDWVARPEEVDLGEGTWLLLARTRAQLAPLAQLARDQGVVYRVKGVGSADPGDVAAILAYEGLRAGRRVDGGPAAAALRAMGVPAAAVDDSRTYTSGELGVDVAPIWHDALVRIPVEAREYYLACLRRGESLTRPPRVRIDTVHGSKGAEAQRVLLVTDLTWRTHRAYRMDPDSEHRVFYVGATRASEGLTLVAPRGAYGYPI